MTSASAQLYALKPERGTALAAMPPGHGNHFWSIAIEEQFYLGDDY